MQTGKGGMVMADRKKVICHLYDCLVASRPENMWVFVRKDIVGDALALLKEQEAVKPEREHSGGGTTWWNVCGNCRTAINPNDKYCHECGKAVKWK